MAFINNDDYSIEYWIAELAELFAVRNGIRKREANLLVLENLSEFIYYYEASFTPKKAYAQFHKEVEV